MLQKHLQHNSRWDLYTEGFKFQSAWTNTTSYKIGEVVSVGGYTYLAAQDSPSTVVTVTAVTAATDTFTIASTTGIVVGMTVRFTGTTFGNVFTTARYYVKTVAAGNITVSTTPGGTTFNITADASRHNDCHSICRTTKHHILVKTQCWYQLARSMVR
jgi:hypothetical protein